MHCDECGFEYASVARDEIASRLRASGAPFTDVLRSTEEARLRRRPAPDVWSALEYGCHVRDVFLVQAERVALALSTDCPRFEPMGRDERAVELRYNEQTPAVVADEIDAAGSSLADLCERLSPDEFARTGLYGYPAPAERTMEWVGQHTIHEAVHHLMDVERSLAAAAGVGD